MDPQHRLIALTVACALFMQSIDSTVLGTALVAIGRDFGVDPVRMHLALTAYLLSLAVIMPLSSWLADRFGARDVFRLAILIFTVASVACAFSSNLGTLVVARFAQGVGGAMLTPVARLALLRAVPKTQLVNAMAWVSIPALVGPLLGPPLGGFLVTYASWPWIFWLNVPIGLLGIWLATRYMENIREPHIRPFDMTGFVLVAVAVCGLLFGFETSGSGLTPQWANLLAVAAGLGCLALFVRHAKRNAAPILDLRLLKLRTFHAGVIGGGLFRIGIGALPFLLPLTLQAGFGFDPLKSGLVTFGAAAGALAMKFLASPALHRFGFRRTLVWNAVLSAVSIAACALFTPATPVWIIFAVLVTGGLFRSLVFTALNAIANADLREEQMSNGTAFAALVQQLSLSMGIGVSAVILDLLRIQGIAPEAGGFRIAFVLVGAIVLVSVLQFWRLPQNAGGQLVGRTGQGKSEGPPKAER